MRPRLALLPLFLLAACDTEESADPAQLLGRRLLVLDSDGGSTSIGLLDPADGSFLEHIAPTGAVPNHLHREGDRLYVSCSGDDRLLCYSIGDSSLVLERNWAFNEIDELPDPQERRYGLWASVTHDGLVYSTLGSTDEIGVLDPQSGEWSRFATGRWPQGLLRRGDRLYVACTGFDPADFSYGASELRVYGLPGIEELYRVPLAPNCQALAFAGDGTLLALSSGDYDQVTGTLQGLDPVDGGLLFSASLDDYPGQLEVAGNRVWLAAWGQYDLTPGGEQSGLVYCYDLAGQAWLRGSGMGLEVGAGATDLEWSGEELLVSCFAADQVCVIRGDSLSACYTAGDGPGALLWLE